MTRAEFELTLGDFRRFLVSSVMASVLCLCLFSAFRFLKTTVREGAERTFSTFADSFSRTTGVLFTKLDQLTEHPEDMGLGATLVNRIPYPESTHQCVDGAGKILRFELRGVNLDRLEQVAFGGMSFVSRTEEAPQAGTFWFNAAFPESLSIEVASDQLSQLPAERTEFTLKSRGAMAGLLVSRYKRVLLVEEERDDLGGIRVPRNQNPDASPSPGAIPIPVAVMTPAPDPEAEDKARASFAALAVRYVSSSDPLQKRLQEKGLRGAPNVVDVTDLLQAIESGALPDAEKNQAFHEVIQSPMVDGPFNSNLPPHGVNDADFQKILETVGRAGLIADLKASSQLKEGLYGAFERGRVIGVTDVKPDGPTTGASVDDGDPDRPALAAPTAAGEYQRLQEDERQFQECMNIIQSVESAHDAFMANAMGDRPIDLQLLRREGFLAAAPACPKGESYDLVENGKRLQCPVHGTKSHPWTEHDRYVAFFREYENAVQLGLHENQPEKAIPVLETYLRENAQNIGAGVLLAELYFQARKYKNAANQAVAVMGPFPHDPRLRYIAGYSFYVIDNPSLTTEHMGFLVRLDPALFDLSQHDSLSTYECFVMQDTAAMVLENLKTGMKFAEFSLQGEPEYPSKYCLENTKQIYELLPWLAASIRGGEGTPGARFRKLKDNLEKAGTAAARVGSNDLPKKKIILETLEKQKVLLKESLLGIVKQIQEGADAILFGSCPEQGIYAVDKAFFVQCTRHPRILPGSKVQVDPGTDVEWEASLLSLALLYDLGNRDKSLESCWYYHQARILDEAFKIPGEPGRFEIPPNADLDQLVKLGRLDPAVVDPEGNEKLSIVKLGETPMLVCNEHPSLLRIQGMTLDTSGDEFRPFRHVQLGP